MDTSLTVSVVIAVVAIVPGVWALVNQAKKDKAETQLNMTKAAQDAAMNIIGPLQAEVTRLQARIIELEKALIEKTTEIGDLMQKNIDKDSEIRTLKYGMEDMQRRLNYFEKKKSRNKTPEETSNEETIITNRIEEDLKSDEAKKEEIKNYTLKSIEQLSNGSLVNLENKTEMEE